MDENDILTKKEERFDTLCKYDSITLFVYSTPSTGKSANCPRVAQQVSDNSLFSLHFHVPNCKESGILFPKSVKSV